MKQAAITLKEKAYIELRRMILNGELKPGAFLTERTLVEMLEMSRTPIRAALERLDVEGLANYTPNKGLVVAEMSIRKVIDLFEYRIAIECFIVRKLSKMIWNTEDLDWFQSNLLLQQELVGSNNHHQFTEADTQFHRRLIAVSGNQEMMSAMDKIQDKLFQIALQVLQKDHTRIGVSYEDHARIFQCIIDGQADDAAAHMEGHLEYGKRILVLD